MKKLASTCLLFAAHLKVIIGELDRGILVNNLQKVIAHCLAEDSELQTRGIKVVDTENIINDLHSKLKVLLTSDLTDESIIMKHNWFQVFIASIRTNS